jgi:type II restriction enzyme
MTVMAVALPDYTGAVQDAVIEYWNVRREQAVKSRRAGVLNTGLRAEVTGGQHLNALQTLLVQVFADAGVPPRLMEVKRRPIPGYFRRDKSWDVVVTIESRVVGIIELKSIVGASPGQNFNNRTDEALGQAMDVWTAVERGIIATPLRPWLGYFMLIEDNAAFNATVSPRTPVWPADPEFDSSSYAKRFEIFFDRMVRERLLDAACLVLGGKESGAIQFPSDTLSFQSFAAAIHGRCLQFQATNPDLPWE